jgi:hypothetical protein
MIADPHEEGTVSDAQVELAVIQTLESTRRGETHWFTRGLAEATGLSRMITKMNRLRV